jgi:hypothetical protein
MNEVDAKTAELRDLATARTSIPHPRSLSGLISAPESNYRMNLTALRSAGYPAR